MTALGEHPFPTTAVLMELPSATTVRARESHSIRHPLWRGAIGISLLLSSTVHHALPPILSPSFFRQVPNEMSGRPIFTVPPYTRPIPLHDAPMLMTGAARLVLHAFEMVVLYGTLQQTPKASSIPFCFFGKKDKLCPCLCPHDLCSSPGLETVSIMRGRRFCTIRTTDWQFYAGDFPVVQH
ncbi:hypothetical protein BKA80DRAFT_3827 [Phyllosticta citrichinensis]